MRSTRRGATALEFGLILPALTLFLAAIVDLGWYFHQRLGVVWAASEGARRASVTARDADWQGAADDRAAEILESMRVDADGATITVEQSEDGNGEDQITVTVSAPFSPLMGIGLTPELLEASASARWEDQGG